MGPEAPHTADAASLADHATGPAGRRGAGMLQELDIESYAVVDRLRVSFQPGLNLLTGETGSGKSIVVGSLALLFGARASADVVRAGAKRARVSGIFDAPRDPDALARLAASGIEPDGELIVERHVLASGKSRAYVDGSPVPLGLVRELAPHLGEIHGQHEQQTLLSAAPQLRLLDAFAGLAADADGLRDVYRRWRERGDELARLKGDAQERLHRIDLLRHQDAEIRDIAPQPGEDDELGAERRRLANVEGLQRACFEAYGALYESGTAASARIKAAADGLSGGGSVDERLLAFSRRLEDARATIDDVAFEVQAYLDGLEADPDRLEAVENRLALLERLKRKYGPTLDDVLAFAERAAEELAALDRSDADVEALEREVAAAGDEYAERAKALTGKRAAAGADLASRAGRHLGELALARSRFQVALEPLAEWSARGADRAAFLFSANPGQPPRPLGQVASGGELSRIALALRTCLVETAGDAGDGRTLVFDEVDAGVGGRVADAIGKRLKGLAAGRQLLCVTHLPQIARFADAHFHVAKEESDGRSTAAIARLTEPERVGELARMLSGAKVTDAALENARQLLQAE